ncbi:MAG: hypothetical protein LBC40_05205 [Dysgonamonadaceae bacterium]|jgi:hypothetical protein|nr:hypothetical protein [Dysgonamonadaceae bacterium]
MKRLFIFMAFAALMSVTKNVYADSPFAGGDGTTEATAYLIETAAQLDSVRNYIPQSNSSTAPIPYFKLMADIDLSRPDNWTPLLGSNGGFIHFDGNLHIIKNMRIVSDANITMPSLFGFATGGSIKNLGLAGVYIDCPKSGAAGAFAGQVGHGGANPSAKQTCSMENCFATGYVSCGGGKVGGIAGTVGRPTLNGASISCIKNCYFSGEVENKYTGTAQTVRTGGISGDTYVNAQSGASAGNTVVSIQNCYAVGYFHAKQGRVGGIVGELTSKIQDCVAYADLEIVSANTNDGIGLLAGYGINTGASNQMGTVDNCWAYTGATMKYAGDVVAPSNFASPASGSTAPVDGTPKNAAFLSVAANYAQLNIDAAVWSSQLRGIYPQLAWVAGRTDAEDIDGLSTPPSMPTGWDATPAQAGDPGVFAAGNRIVFTGIREAYRVAVYDVRGKLLKSFEQNEDGAAMVGTDKDRFLIVKMVNSSGGVFVRKLVY